MQYQGGKSRIAKPISEVINALSRRKVENCEAYFKSDNERSSARERERVFVSLFCGSCTVESKINGFDKMILNDKHKYLIALLQGVQAGYELPEYISEEQYRYIKFHKDEDRVLSGFVGFGCSFGGRWFEGYARNKTGTNYAAQSKRSLLKDMVSLKDAVFICSDYREVKLPDGCVIYADPPYNGTKRYSNEKFDSASFWEYARETSKTHLMFISEQHAPDDFIPIWQKQITRTLDVNKCNQFKVTEKLFIHNSYRQLAEIIRG